MERVILFRFHREPDVCRTRLELLRSLNPGVPIYGLGEPIGLDGAFEHLHVIEDRPPEWKWQHGDLAVADWYRAVGRERPFDVLHLIEWDLLPCVPLAELYDHVPVDGLALSGLRPMTEARRDGWSWITDEGKYKHADDYRRLREYVSRELGFDDEGPSCIFPGATFPREFLSTYADLDVPELCNDEVRVPLVARALGFDLSDTGFHQWTDEGRQYFNGRNDEIPPDRIAVELADPDGRRVFHPVRQSICETVLDYMI